MLIYVNLPPEMVNDLRLNGSQFKSMESGIGFERESVAVIIGYGGFTDYMIKSVDAMIPVIALAGQGADRDNPVFIEARTAGIPEQAVVYKDGDHLWTYGGHQFRTRASKGANPAVFVEMAEFAWERKLLPEPIILWNPDQDQVNEAGMVYKAGCRETRQESENQTDVLGLMSYTVEETMVPGTETKPNRAISSPDDIKSEGPKWINAISNSMALNDLLDRYPCRILAIRTVPEAQSSDIARDLAIHLGALHLEVNTRPDSFRSYGARSIEEAVLSGQYACSQGEDVQIAEHFHDGKYLVIEMDITEISPYIVDSLHEQAGIIIHIPGEYDESVESLDQWLETEATRLDAIIPDRHENLLRYGQRFSGLVMSVDDFVASELGSERKVC